MPTIHTQRVPPRKPCHKGMHFRPRIADLIIFPDHQDMSNTSTLFSQAQGLYQDGRLGEAKMLYERLLVMDGDHVDALTNLGTLCLQQGRIEEGARHLEKSLQLSPNQANVHYNLAIVRQGQGRLEEALACYDQALVLRPDHVAAQNNRGLALQALNRLDQALSSFDRAIALMPGYALAHNNRGNVLRDLKRVADALASFNQAIRINTDYAEAHFNRALALLDLKRPVEALESLTRAIALQPDYPEAHNQLGVVLLGLNRMDEALTRFQHAIDLKPEYADAHDNLGGLLLELDRAEEAVASHEHAIALDANFAEAHNNKGTALMQLGRMDEAKAAFRRALELKPEYAEAHYHRAFLERSEPGDPTLELIESMLDTAGISVNERIYLHYTAGKVLDDIGQTPDRAFLHFAQGARLKRAEFKYDVAKDEAFFDSIKRSYNAERLANTDVVNTSNHTPVFIVGMPRSGTTLTEQILASHPRVYAAGERPDLNLIIQETSLRLASHYPDWINQASSEILSQVGRQYRQRVVNAKGAQDRVTDKMPTNFRHLGLIALALPDSRVIHIRRDPVAICLSCFTNLFTNGQPYSYDLVELGHYFLAYEKLMAHWRQVLPMGFMLEIEYEELVNDTENVARRMLAHCGLEWDPACLRSHETNRLVKTASVAQVRQPIHQTSIARWKRYESHLGPLLDVLGVGTSDATLVNTVHIHAHRA